MTIGEALELIADLAAALDHVQVEFELLEETPVPLGDKVLKGLEERDALAATLKRMVEQAGSPQVRAAAQRIYREELSGCTRTDDGPTVPVDADTKARLADVRELLRRRALTDRGLDLALRGLS